MALLFYLLLILFKQAQADLLWLLIALLMSWPLWRF